MKIGCDVVDLKRIKEDDLVFARGILSPNEFAIYKERKNKRDFLGGRFAAKEAFLKAIGKGLSGARMSDIDISYTEDGQPELFYDGEKYSVSISHDGDYSFAVVII